MNVEMLRVGQVAKLIGCAESTIWRLVSSGKFPEPRRIGGMTRWRRADIFALIDGPANKSNAAKDVRKKSKVKLRRRSSSLY